MNLNIKAISNYNKAKLTKKPKQFKLNSEYSDSIGVSSHHVVHTALISRNSEGCQQVDAFDDSSNSNAMFFN